jgi:hypothetical protein
MHRLDVPYYSQHNDIAEPHWQTRSCGVVCVKMVLELLKPDDQTSIDTLIDEAVLMNGYTRHGWSHDVLVNLFRNHGVHAYREEFRSIQVNAITRNMQPSVYEPLLVRNGISKIANVIVKGKPVIVSVDAGFDENKSTHLIVLTGVSEEGAGFGGFFYNDSDSKGGVKKDMFVELSKFRQHWRKLAIFVG